MSFELLHAAADSNRWAAILPEVSLGCLALLLLVLEMVLPRAAHRAIPVVAIAGQAVLLAFLLASFCCASGACGVGAYLGTETFNGLLLHTRDGQFMRVFFLLTSLLVSVLGVVSLGRRQLPRVEFFSIVLVIGGALMLLAQSNHFVMLFVALETVTVGFYILVSYFRTSALSLEAGLKYLITGALSSGLLLFGIVLLYGVSGNPLLIGSTENGMHFGELRGFLAANPDNFLASLGIVLVLSGVCFKIGAFPFQIWVPDVYQGAPTPVTAYLAVGSKAAGFAILLILVHTAFAPYAGLVIPVLTVLAALTLVFGNLAALTQHNVKRLIGLSGVSHAGFLLLGVVASLHSTAAIGAVQFYLGGYLLASFAVFGVMTQLARADGADADAIQELDDYAGLAKTQPFLALVLVIGLGSLAGIPPLVGFMGKLFIFISAFQAELYGLLAVAVLGVVVSIYYYFGWVRAALFGEPDGASKTASADRAAAPVAAKAAALVAAEPASQPAPSWSIEFEEDTPLQNKGGSAAGVCVCTPVKWALGLLAAAVVFFGFYQGALGDWLLSR